MKNIGRCAKCRRKLLLNPDNGLCVMCENVSLKEKITELELSLVQSRREKQSLYEKLSQERTRGVIRV